MIMTCLLCHEEPKMNVGMLPLDAQLTMTGLKREHYIFFTMQTLKIHVYMITISCHITQRCICMSRFENSFGLFDFLRLHFRTDSDKKSPIRVLQSNDSYSNVDVLISIHVLNRE